MNKFKVLTIILLALASNALMASETPKPNYVKKDFLIAGGLVHRGNGQKAQIQNILVQNGVITKIGNDFTLPADISVVDATNKYVYPGLIVLDAQLGLNEIEMVRPTDDDSDVGQFNPNLNPLFAYDARTVMIPTVRSNGILLAQIAPISSIFSGLTAIVQLDAWNVKDAQYSKVQSLMMEWPQNPADSEIVYEHFEQAQAYALKQNTGKSFEKDLRLEVLVKALKGELKVFVRAYSETQIRASIEFLKKYNLQGVLVGAHEAYLAIDEIKASGFPVALATPFRLPNYDDEDIDLSFQLAKILSDAKIPFALLSSGHFNGSYRNLPFVAGVVASRGLSEEEALEAVTLSAAKILGISDRAGSIEVGKDANIIISEGPLMEIATSQVSRAWIQGREIDLNNHQKDLYKRYSERAQEDVQIPLRPLP